MQWKLIEELPYYEVSEYGDVRRIKTGKIIKPVSNRGYQRYALCRYGEKRKGVWAHILVLNAFVGPKPSPDLESCHKDNNRANNHYSNLRWGTHQSNMDDMVAHGTRRVIGARKTAINPDEVSEIKRMLASGRAQRAVAAEFSVGKSTVGRIALRM